MPAHAKTKPLLAISAATLLGALSSASRGADATDTYFAGLDALSAGKYEQALGSLTEAASAEPDVAAIHLHRAIALLLLDKADAARDAIAVAAKLNAQSEDIREWSQVRAIIYEPTLPAIAPPRRGSSFSVKLQVAALGARSPDAAERARARKVLEEAAREFASMQRNGPEGVKVLYRAKRYRDALAQIDSIRGKGAFDKLLIGYAGHCKLGLEDYAGARGEYTEALAEYPLDAGYLIGRARAEAGVGAFDAADADLALARRLGAKSLAAHLADAERFVAVAKQKPQNAVALVSRREAYTRELSRLRIDLRDRPQDLDAHLAMFEFYLRPTAVCTLKLGGVMRTGRVPCAGKDAKACAEVQAASQRLAPDDPRVILNQARLDIARSRPDDMMVSARRALDLGVTDLEIAVAYAHYNIDLARRMSFDASNLRAPGIFVWVRNSSGVWTQEFRGPNGEDYSRAENLDRRAKELNADATRAFESLQKQTAGKPDTASQVTQHMVNAYHELRFNRLDGAIASAEKALELDPLHEHALRFLADACAKTAPLKSQQYRAMLAELQRY